MSSVDMILGELREFKRATLHRLDEIERQVAASQRFRWKMIGAAGVVAFIVGVATKSGI